MKKILSFVLIILIAFSSSSCSLDYITMPHGTVEYRNGTWTVDQLVAHFTELGFSDIEVRNLGNYYGEIEKVEIYNVLIEDSSSDSWFTQYKAFTQGEAFGSWLEIKIETYTYGPTYGSETDTDNNVPKTDPSETDPSETDPSETDPPQTKPPASEENNDNGRDYVVNKNTKKFHYPSCSSADDIKASNRWEYHGTREDLIEKGYDPCKRCKP